ncbi:hypothetical protein ACFWFH_38020 [Streptomyces coelicoflavus]|uniref:hypothetical protein n=1 Tax=Streptomyces TaxID=1883 RepID=UPI001291F283|nr:MULTISPECIES: hypothetical protein [Streptomyces]MCX5039474.1 hypothetical protein [Streptomyces coelicoflavus]
MPMIAARNGRTGGVGGLTSAFGPGADRVGGGAAGAAPHRTALDEERTLETP